MMMSKSTNKIAAPSSPSPLRAKGNTSIRGTLLKTQPDVETQRKRPPPPRSQWTVQTTPKCSGLLNTLAVSLWLGWMGFLVYAIAILALLGSSTAWAVFLGACTLSLALPRQFPGRLGHKIGDALLKRAEAYFSLKTVVEDADELAALPELGRAAIYAFEPHDVLPFPIFSFNNNLERVPGFAGRCECLMTSAVFCIPFLRQIYTWTGGAPVDRKTFRRKLDRKESFVFCPGGVQEVTLMDPNNSEELVLYLQKRKGFIKQALATGSPIVPAFGFNTDGSYLYWVPKGSLVNKIARSIGFLPIFFAGRFGLPFGIPFAQDLHVVVGRPIYVPTEGDTVRPESVEKYHALFLEAMEGLFERHKEEAGYGHRKLKIL